MAETCLRCAEPVEEDASACPHCDYAPGERGRTVRIAALFVAALLCLTVVGAVVGIPLAALVLYMEVRAQDMTPGATQV